jgi:hypothetical protein
LSNRKQKQQENIRNFSNALKMLAKETFPNVELTSIDGFLKQTFQRGILDPELRLIALEKLNKMNNKQDKSFNIVRFINYVHNKEQARIEIARSTAYEYDNSMNYSHKPRPYYESTQQFRATAED